MTIKVCLTQYIHTYIDTVHTYVHCRYIPCWGSHFAPTPSTTLLGVAQITSNRSSHDYICYTLIMLTASLLRKDVGELLGRIVSKVSTDPRIWKLYSELHLSSSTSDDHRKVSMGVCSVCAVYMVCVIQSCLTPSRV